MLIGQRQDLLPYLIAFTLLMELSSAMWKENTTNQLGSSLHQISLGSALHDTSFVQLPKQADAPAVRAILQKKETMPRLLRAETTRNKLLNI